MQSSSPAAALALPLALAPALALPLASALALEAALAVALTGAGGADVVDVEDAFAEVLELAVGLPDFAAEPLPVPLPSSPQPAAAAATNRIIQGL